MSRIGKKPITIPDKVTFEIKDQIIFINGPLGSLECKISDGIDVRTDAGNIIVENKDFSNKVLRAKHGLYRSLIANMVTGVNEGFQKELEIIGVGYKVQQSGSDVQLNLGYSHPIIYKTKPGVKIEAIDLTHLKVFGVDKQQVGQVAAEIRELRPPEPYKGKGVRYKNEIVRRKAGKSGKK